MKEDYSKISPTAVFCARMRAKQDIPFAKEIVELIDTKFKDSVEDLPDYGDTLTSKSDFIPFIEGRYYSLNDALKNMKNVFILELASGLSPRSLNFLKKDVIYLDTDLKNLIEVKKKIFQEIIKKSNLDRSNLFFMEANPLEEKDIDSVGLFYQNQRENKQLIVIHEGLLMYFNREEKKKFMENIKKLFEKYAPNGLLMTTDLSRTTKKENSKKGQENIRDKIATAIKNDFDYFDSEEEAKQFVSECGFKLEILANKKVIEELIAKKGLEKNKVQILETAKEYRVWKIRLA